MTNTNTSIRNTASSFARVQGSSTGRPLGTGIVAPVPVRTVSPQTVTPRVLSQRDDAWDPQRADTARAGHGSGRPA